jgi:hypothetical protein
MIIKRFDGYKAMPGHPPAESSTELADVSRRARSIWRRVERVVADHPKQSLLAALAAGAVVGWLTKRR